MNILKDCILIILVCGFGILGYCLMAGLDKFLDEHHEIMKKETKKREPSCVMLTEAMSDEEIAEEIRRFRSKHEGTRIVLYDSLDMELSENMENIVK